MSRHSTRPPSQRQLRVGEEIRHALAMALERGEVRDPEIKNVAVTVTEVRISPDLKNATAYVVPLGGGDSSKVVAALNKASGFLRSWVAKNVRVRHVPRISFTEDQSFDEAARIEGMLLDPRVQQDIAKTDAIDSDDG